MVQLEEAIEILRQQVTQIGETEEILLPDAVGRRLAEEGKAMTDQPPFPRSPLDGYAVRGTDTEGASAETPKCLQVIGKVYAGGTFPGVVRENQAVRIMTGAPIPAGADTVIRQEHSDYGEEQVRIYKSSAPYENYCPQGEDYKEGTVLLEKGTVLDGTSVALLASLGMSRVKVYRRARVGVISTGDEVIQPGEALRPGKIYDSNLHFICGRLTELGTPPVYFRHCGDDAEKMAEMIRKMARQTDLIVTTGGVSVGQHDIMHEVVERLDAKKLFWRVALKPGAPTIAAVYEDTLLICLSGNPFGAAANFELLVRPVVGKMTGDARWSLKTRRAVMQNDFLKSGGVRRFVRGYAEDGKAWIQGGNHASGALSSMLGCNCLLEITPEQNGVRKGEEVWIHLL